MPCSFCDTEDNLTKEHVIPASLGGTDVVEDATCRKCNGEMSDEFEATFLNSMKPLLAAPLLGIPNRDGVVANAETTVEVGGRKFRALLGPNAGPDGIKIINDAEEGVDEHGRKYKEYWLFDKAGFEKLEMRAQERGEKLVLHSGDTARPLVVEPTGLMPLNFLETPETTRAIAKIALMTIAFRCGLRVARSASFADIRNFIKIGAYSPVRLAFNQTFADSHNFGPFCHAVFVYLDGQRRTGRAVVVLFGGLFYAVNLSASYQGADVGFTYVIDARTGKALPVLVGNIDNERLATEDAFDGETTFDELETSCAHWTRIIQSAADVVPTTLK